MLMIYAALGQAGMVGLIWRWPLAATSANCRASICDAVASYKPPHRHGQTAASAWSNRQPHIEGPFRAANLGDEDAGDGIPMDKLIHIKMAGSLHRDQPPGEQACLAADKPTRTRPLASASIHRTLQPLCDAGLPVKIPLRLGRKPAAGNTHGETTVHATVLIDHPVKHVFLFECQFLAHPVPSGRQCSRNHVARSRQLPKRQLGRTNAG